MEASILALPEHSLINKNSKLKQLYKVLTLLFVGIIVFLYFQNKVSKKKHSALTIPAIEKAFNDPEISKDSLGRYLLKEKVFSGYLVSHFQNGMLSEKHGFLEGIQAGMSIGYYPNGTIKYKRPYARGEKHGEHLGWYSNGQLKFHYIFEDGLSIGNHKDWYEDGKAFKDSNYKAGHPFGSQKMWRPDGKIRANFVIMEDGRKYGLTGLKRCSKIDSETKNIDPFLVQVE